MWNVLATRFISLNDDKWWQKKIELKNIDVSMGSFEGSGVSNLKKLLLLDKLSEIIAKTDNGLSSDGEVILIYSKSGSKLIS